MPRHVNVSTSVVSWIRRSSETGHPQNADSSGTLQRSPPARRLSTTNERAYRCRASQPQIENDRKPTGGVA